MKEKTQSDYLCAGDSPASWTVESIEGIVEDSEKAFISVSSDLLGPTLENLGNLIRMPYGCGEQNMLNFAPNIFILQYLDASDQVTPEIEQKLKDFMNSGYQRELNYRHDDASYSAFGNSDPSGSTWLTAFVLKSFAQASDYITVDTNDLEVTQNWLLSLQNIDGCFESLGSVIHKDMQGGLPGSGGSLAPLTSYVVISLLEANQLDTMAPITEAINCIQADTITNAYVNALKAYALALANTGDIETLITSVYDELITGNSGLPKATAVEAAGYLLLAMLKSDPDSYVGKSAAMAKFISSYRNGEGGFVSTQDTVVALQALAMFSITFPPSNTDLTLSVTAGDTSHEFSITPENRLLLQTKIITAETPFNVTVSPSGEGCAVVMLVQRYNVPEEAKSSAFNMSVTTTRKDCSSLFTVLICSSYLLEDEKSNMVLIEVEPETGYSVIKEDLDALITEEVIKRYDEEEGKVLLYLESVTAKRTCGVIFDIKKDFEVVDGLPGTATLYDYYNPDQTITKKLQTDDGECVLPF